MALLAPYQAGARVESQRQASDARRDYLAACKALANALRPLPGPADAVPLVRRCSAIWRSAGSALSQLANLHLYVAAQIAGSGMACDKPSDVILFWFGQEWVDGGMDAKEYADRGIKRWFFGGPALDAECQKFIPLIRAAGAGNLRGEAWDDVPGLIALSTAAGPAHAQRLPRHAGGVRLRQRGAAGGRAAPDRFAVAARRPALAGGRIHRDEPPARRGRTAPRPRRRLPWLVNPTRPCFLTSLRPSSRLRCCGSTVGIRTGTARSAARPRRGKCAGSPPTRFRGGRGASRQALSIGLVLATKLTALIMRPPAV